MPASLVTRGDSFLSVGVGDMVSRVFTSFLGKMEATDKSLKGFPYPTLSRQAETTKIVLPLFPMHRKDIHLEDVVLVFFVLLCTASLYWTFQFRKRVVKASFWMIGVKLEGRLHLILKAKCSVCHRIEYTFAMVFSAKEKKSESKSHSSIEH